VSVDLDLPSSSLPRIGTRYLVPIFMSSSDNISQGSEAAGFATTNDGSIMGARRATQDLAAWGSISLAANGTVLPPENIETLPTSR
jgi:hypothetical protein